MFFKGNKHESRAATTLLQGYWEDSPVKKLLKVDCDTCHWSSLQGEAILRGTVPGVSWGSQTQADGSSDIGAIWGLDLERGQDMDLHR